MTLKHPFKGKLNESSLKRMLSSSHGNLVSVRPANVSSYQEVFIPFKSGTFSQLEKLDFLCTNGDGKTFPLSLLCKRYQDAKKREVRDEVRLFKFYDRIFEGMSPFPKLMEYTINNKALLREFIEGVTLEEALEKFDKLILEKKDILHNSQDSIERKKSQSEQYRLQRNRESLKNAVLNLLATIHHHGTESKVDLSEMGGIQKYKIAKPDVVYYANDFASHFEKLLRKLNEKRNLNLSQGKISELRQDVYEIFCDSPISQYIGKARDALILGDCHLNNFIVYEYINSGYNGGDSDIYSASEVQVNSESLVKHIKFIDLGKARVGASASDIADLSIYPEFSSSVWDNRNYVRTYLNQLSRLQGRVMPSEESFEFERGTHYFAIVRALHAADVHPDHQEKNLNRLLEELEDDSKLSRLKDALEVLYHK